MHVLSFFGFSARHDVLAQESLGMDLDAMSNLVKRREDGYATVRDPHALASHDLVSAHVRFVNPYETILVHECSQPCAKTDTLRNQDAHWHDLHEQIACDGHHNGPMPCHRNVSKTAASITGLVDIVERAEGCILNQQANEQQQHRQCIVA